MTIIGAYKEDVVLVGGWVPYFLCEAHKKEHTGSMDIDVALDFHHIDQEGYKTIQQLLNEKGYQVGSQPFIYHRTLTLPDGREMTVDLNFLAGEYGGSGKSRRTQKVQDVSARKARGCDVAFEHTFTVNLENRMPDGAVNSVQMKVAGTIPFIVMKGMALWERYKEKDAYDIYFTIRNHADGTTGLVTLFEPYLKEQLIREGLEKIKNKFKTIDSVGPVWVANFMEEENEEESQRIQRDAYERVNAFLDLLNVEPYKE
ncbi:MAG: hypothetical protein K8I00_06780 [Candidatus Omnitrophica bacterium]|nr:hypothetical protein [Candidatus Omnitrophota bacterium]